MLENASITLSANNAINLEMFVWDGTRIPVAVQITALRDAGDAAEGMTFHVMTGTPSESSDTLELERGFSGSNYSRSKFRKFSSNIRRDSFRKL